MQFIRRADAEAEYIPEPNKRIIQHLAAPWNIGTKNVWVGSTELEPGFSSNEHVHDSQEEVFYCERGHGRIRVGDEVQDVEEGDVVYVPAGQRHQLINRGTEIFRTINVVSPPFVPERFRADHNLK